MVTWRRAHPMIDHATVLWSDWDVAALALLDDASDDADVAAGGFAEEPPPPSAQRGAKATTRSTLCRQRQREELAQLREQAHELEMLLSLLKLQRRSLAGPTRVANVWRRIAVHQHRRKLRAQHENATLRRLVREQESNVKRLQKMIWNRALETACQEALAPSTAVCGVSDNASSGESIYLDQPLVTERYIIQPIVTADGRTVLEASYSRVFPFRVDETMGALWHGYCATFFPLVKGYYSALHSSDTRLEAKFEVPLTMEGVVYTARSCFTMRRVEYGPTRIAFMWETHPFDVVDGSTVIAVDVVGRLTIEQVEEDGEGDPLCVVRLSSVTSPSSQQSPVVDPLGPTQHELIELYEDTAHRFFETAETLLLDGARNQKKSLSESLVVDNEIPIQ